MARPEWSDLPDTVSRYACTMKRTVNVRTAVEAWRRLPRPCVRVVIVYAAVTLACWSVPLLSILHVESSAIVATAAFFAAGLSSLILFAEGRTLREVLVLQEALLLVPWTLLTVTVLWQPNCAYFEGLRLYAAYTAVTVCFAVSLARMLAATPVRRKALYLTAVGLILLLAGPLYDVGFHPQFYTYNHVFGGFLGPIYDEQLEIRPGFFAFRTLTLLWSVLFVLIAERIERSAPPHGLGVVASLILACYVFAPSLGIVTTRERIRDALGSIHRTAHFDIYFDSSAVSGDELRRIADEHEFRYTELGRELRIDVTDRIETYLYPSPDVKARLTGARYTSVAPVWLPNPQMHILQENFEAVFPHELVHVFSREFGLPWVRASLSVGLIEGLAVALEPPDGRPDPHEQVSAALFVSDVARPAGGDPAAALAEAVAARVSPLGFWTGRGAVSYTMMGSFVRFLLDAYGPDRLKEVYARARFADTYGKSLRELASEWAERLLSIDAVSTSAADFVAARFAVPSLFEKDCPHYVPPYRRRYLEATDALAAGDSVRAYALTEQALRVQPRYVPALDLWARLALVRGEDGEVIRRIEGLDEEVRTTALTVRLGDAYALRGESEAARAHYLRARRRLPSFAHEAASLVELRTAAAGHPSAVRILVQRRAEETGDSAVERLVSALDRARANEYEQAVRLLRTTSARSLLEVEPEIGGALERRRLVWTGRFAYRAGLLGEAGVYADSAAAAYRKVGAFNEADVQRDFGEMVRWLLTLTQSSDASMMRDLKQREVFR